MQSLQQKHILLGISGGIAAYKSAELARLLSKAGAEVRVVMTQGAQQFITPLTLQALSGNPVHSELLDPAAEAGMGHIELARWADLVLIAPATAELMARLAHGHADDLLTTLCLATTAPIALAPAMNQAMWRHAATQANATLLARRGVTLLGPAHGEQACGDTGPGRMLEPEQLLALTAELFTPGVLQGHSVTITAGPTREAIDPVRYISNHSSGKMGFALAQAAARAGARVNLIAGPVALATPAGVNRIDVSSAEEMLAATLSTLADTDIFIASAAVADYRPLKAAEQKIKKSRAAMQIELTRNPDIVATVAAHAQRPFTVGFAAETQQVVEYAKSKLEKKNLDMIVANDVSQAGIGFNSDHNAVTLLWRNEAGQILQDTLPQATKQQLAVTLIQRIADLFKARQPEQR